MKPVIVAAKDGTFKVFDDNTGHLLGFEGCTANRWLITQKADGYTELACVLQDVPVIQGD